VPNVGQAQEATAIETNETQLLQAQARLDELHHQEEVLAEEYNGAAVQLEQTKKLLEATQDAIDEYTKTATKAQAELEVRAADAYRAGIGAPLQAIFEGGSLSDISDRITFLTSMMEQTEGIALEAQGATASAQEAQVYFKEAQAQIQSHRTVLDRNRKAIEGIITQQEELIGKFETRLEEAIEAAKISRLAPDPGDVRWPVGSGDATVTEPPPPVHPKAQIAIDVALDQVGKDYVWAADGPDSFDCSGLMMYAWAKAGVKMYHYSQYQYNDYPHVLTSQIKPGDMVFYGTGTSGISHVAMYIGNDQIVQAQNSQVGVVISPFSSFWTSGYVGAARPG